MQSHMKTILEAKLKFACGIITHGKMHGGPPFMSRMICGTRRRRSVGISDIAKLKLKLANRHHSGSKNNNEFD